MRTAAVSIIALMFALCAQQAVAATTEQSPAQVKKGMGRGPMTPSKEPHHVLALAYHQNMATFAKALHEHEVAGGMDILFARTAASEMRRSYSQMKQHHQQHVEGMDAASAPDAAGDKDAYNLQQRAHRRGLGLEVGANQPVETSNTHRQMTDQEVELGIQLTVLEQELRSAAPDRNIVSTQAHRVHQRLTALAPMHEHCR